MDLAGPESQAPSRPGPPAVPPPKGHPPPPVAPLAPAGLQRGGCTPASHAAAPPAAEWGSRVGKPLKGQPLATLVTATAEGRPVAPLYLPGEGPRTVLGLPARDAERPWDLRAAVAHPDPARANADLLADLKGGAAPGPVRLDPTAARGVSPRSAAHPASVSKAAIVTLDRRTLLAGPPRPQPPRRPRRASLALPPATPPSPP